MTEFTLDPVRVLTVSILVLWLGNFVERRLPFLSQNNIPSAVSGGLICSVVVALLAVFADVRVNFNLEMRDTLLLVFFSTIGLSAKFSQLAAGGRALAVLLLITIVFLLARGAARGDRSRPRLRDLWADPRRTGGWTHREAPDR
jgi:ESS family glutamate:Na+ symporter